MRSSEWFYKQLINHKLIGSYIKNYLEGKGMPIRVKLVTLSLLWISILLSVVFAVEILILRIMLLCIAAGVTAHIILIRKRE
jgi:uncharacterized membrane protein YbaN (DUF454 family)